MPLAAAIPLLAIAMFALVRIPQESTGKLFLAAAIAYIVLLIIIAVKAGAHFRQVQKVNRKLICENKQRKLAEAALQQANDTLKVNADARAFSERLWLVLQSGKMGTFEIDLVTGAGQWNETVYELLGIMPGDIPAGPELFFKSVHPEDLEMTRAQWHNAQEFGNLDMEFRVVHPDGQVRWLCARGQFISGSGRATRFLGVTFDITDHKEMEISLRKSESKFRSLFESSPDCVFLTCPDGSINAANPAACALFDRSEQQLCSMKRSDILNVADPRFSEAFEERSQTGRIERRVLTAICKNGSVFPVEVDSVLMPDNTNQAFVVIRDITERKQIEDALHRSEELNRQTLQALPVHIAVLNHDGGIISVNHAWMEFARDNDADGSPAVAVGANYIDVCAQAIKDADIDAVNAIDGIKAVLGGKIKEFTLEYPCHSPLEKRWFVMTAVAFGEGGAVITHINITERKQAEESLRERERLLQEIIDGSTSPIFLKDLDGKFITINAALEKMLGMSRQDIKGKTDYDIAPKETADYWRSHDAKVLTTGKAIQIEEIADLPDGRHIFLANKFPLLNSGGQVYGIGAISHDITDRKKAEAALRLSEEKYRSLFNTMSEGFALHEIIYNENGKPCDYRYIEVNAAFERMTGLKSDNLLGKRVLEVLPQTEEYWIESFGKVALTGKSAHIENYSAALGRWYDVFAYRPEPNRFAAVITDITDRKLAENAILAAKLDAENDKKRLEAIMQALPVALVITDTKGGIVLTNDIDNKIWGNRPQTEGIEDYHGYKAWWLDTGNPVEPQEWASAQAVLNAKTVLGQHLEIERSDGTHGFVINSAAPIKNVDGEITGSVVIIQDITDLVFAEQALKKLNDTLEQQVEDRTIQVRQQAIQLRALASQLSMAEQTERQRLAKILHDHIQQLIVGARMQTSQIRRDNDLDRIHDTADEVSAILKEALDASRSLAIDLSPPVLHEAGLIGGLDWLADRLYRNNKFTLDLHLENNAEPASEEIKYLLFECARELTLNAVKHSGVSQAQVTLSRSQDGRIKLIVGDNGQGFDPDMLKYRQIDDVSFGLFSVQQRLEHIGGRVEINAAPGKGTVVTLTVPDRRKANHTEQTAQAKLKNQSVNPVTQRPKSKLCRVLICDDHKVMRQGLSKLLQYEPGVEVVGEAEDGPRGIELAEKLKPNIVIMDVSMGKMSGIDATRQIVAANPQIKVIGLSMYENKETVKAMHDAGAVAYFMKSGTFDDLMALVRDMCR